MTVPKVPVFPLRDANNIPSLAEDNTVNAVGVPSPSGTFLSGLTPCRAFLSSRRLFVASDAVYAKKHGKQ